MAKRATRTTGSEGGGAVVLEVGTRPEELLALTRDAATMATTAQGLVRVETRTDAERAGQFLRAVRETTRKIKAKYKEIRKPVRDALTRIGEMEAADLAPYEAADRAVAAPLLAFTTLERQRVEAENRRRLQEAEERSRQEKAQAAEALRAAAATADTASERRALETQARRVERAPVLPVAVERAEDFKIAGVATPTRYRGEVANWDLFIRAVASGRIPRSAVKVDQSFVDKQANDLGRDLNWPGVTVVEDTTLSARGFGG